MPIYNLNTCEINVPFLKSNFQGLFFTINIFALKFIAHILLSKTSFVLISNTIVKFIFVLRENINGIFIHIKYQFIMLDYSKLPFLK